MKQFLSWILALLLLTALVLTMIFARPESKPEEPDVSLPEISSSWEEPLPEEPSAEPESSAPQTPAKDRITVPSSDAGKGPLTVISARHPLKVSRADEMIQFYSKYNQCYKFSTTEVYIDPDTLEHFNAMTAAFAKKTGLRDIALFAAYNGKNTAEDAATGRNVTLSIAKDNGSILMFAGQDAYRFFYTSGPDYGFVLRYPKDKQSVTGHAYAANQLRYVGIPHAAVMTEKKLCLEEYTDLLAKKHPAGRPLSYRAPDGTSWLIYSVPVSKGSKTESPLVDCKKYTVSGDNCGHLIVTAQTA